MTDKYLCKNSYFIRINEKEFVLLNGKYAKTMNKLFLLDAYALIYRAYYAFIKNPRINSKGLNTSAILGRSEERRVGKEC